MRVIQVTATAGTDGRLQLDIPTGAAGATFDVAVVLHPTPMANGTGHQPAPDELGWPPGYFENTYGSVTDDTFVRHPPPELMRTCGVIDDDTFDARRPTDLPPEGVLE